MTAPAMILNVTIGDDIINGNELLQRLNKIAAVSASPFSMILLSAMVNSFFRKNRSKKKY
jgi:choline-glycine betaine transporter